MTRQMRVLKTREDYARAIERMSQLMGKELREGSDDEAEFELLEALIRDFDARHVPPPRVTPLEAIKFRMQQKGLAKKDLVPYIGALPKVSEVMSGERPLSLGMLKRLHKGLGIPATVLLGDDDFEQNDVSLDANYDFSKFPLQEMQARALLPAEVSAAELKSRAEEFVKAFLRDVMRSAREPALLRAPLFQSGARTMDDYALLVWRASVVRKAQKAPLPKRFQPGTITANWLRDVAKLSSFLTGPRLAQEHLANHGIALVVERHFKKTYLDGAAMMLDGRPIVALTLRHDRVDNFFFALLHELVHVQKHLVQRPFIADNLEDKTREGDKDENEADQGAQEALIPSELWRKSRVRTTFAMEDALDLAREAGVHPAIVAGRVRYETGNWRLLANLISQAGSVTEFFKDQLHS